MLLLNRSTGEYKLDEFRSFPTLLRPGDCLILNDTKVIPARLWGRPNGRTGTGILLEQMTTRPGRQCLRFRKVQSGASRTDGENCGGSSERRNLDDGTLISDRPGRCPRHHGTIIKSLPPHIEREPKPMIRSDIKQSMQIALSAGRRRQGRISQTISLPDATVAFVARHAPCRCGDVQACFRRTDVEE